MHPTTDRLSRRDVLKYIAAVSAASALGETSAFTAEQAAKGYGTDPSLAKIYARGDVWPLTFSGPEKTAATALADVIFPADDLGPAASALRVTDFIDEWVSAPYPDQQGRRPVILEGLAWLDAESQKRFAKPFAAASAEQKTAICDDIAWPDDAKPEYKKGAEFFIAFRALAAAAYYGTPEGWTAIGYVGNVPLPTFDGPPKEVLERLGLEQTVK
jgi:hypothetical protein